MTHAVTIIEEISKTNAFIDQIMKQVNSVPNVDALRRARNENPAREAIGVYSMLLKDLTEFVGILKYTTSAVDDYGDKTAESNHYAEEGEALLAGIKEATGVNRAVSNVVNGAQNDILALSLEDITAQLGDALIAVERMTLSLRGLLQEVRKIYSDKIAGNKRRFSGVKFIARQDNQLQLDVTEFQLKHITMG